MPSPSPRPPPVTSATRPSRRNEGMVNSVDIVCVWPGRVGPGPEALLAVSLSVGVTAGSA